MSVKMSISGITVGDALRSLTGVIFITYFAFRCVRCDPPLYIGAMALPLLAVTLLVLNYGKGKFHTTR